MSPSAEIQQKIDAQLKELGYQYSVEPGRLHSSVRVANNDDAYKCRTYNTVASEHLPHHVYYNTFWRCGQALFIDGKCVYTGMLGEERCADIEKELAKNPPALHSAATTPYK